MHQSERGDVHRSTSGLYFTDSDKCESFHGYTWPSDSYEQVNGRIVDVALGEQVRSIVSRYEACPYCFVSLDIHLSTERMLVGDEEGREAYLRVCRGCGFWCTRARRWSNEKFTMRSTERVAAAVQRKFQINAPDAPIRELAEFVRRHPDEVYRLSPIGFERLVTECFRRNWRPVDAIHVGRPDDGGVDVVLVCSDKHRWLVQCKRRTDPAATEPVSTVRALLGTLLSEGAMRGIVVTTADHFSYQAERLSRASCATTKGYEVKLVDYGILREMLVGSGMEPTIELAHEREVSPVDIWAGPWTDDLRWGS